MSQQIDPGFGNAEPGFGADAVPETEPEDTVDAEAEAEEQVEDQESEAESPAADEENVEKKTDPFQERIDKLTKNWRETERALEALERENTELRKKVSEMPARREPEKTLSDFDYDERKYAEYVYTNAREVAREAAQEAISGRDRENRALEAQSKFLERERAFKESVKDYEAVAYARDLRISDAMADVIKDSEIGPELAYHLGKNPDVARSIHMMPPAVAARAMTILESDINAEMKKAGSKRKVSDAPPPPATKLGGGESVRRPATTSPDSDKLSDSEWFEAERKRLAKKRG